MNRRDFLLLFILGLAFTGVISAFQDQPGYMDADYYMLGGQNIVRGLGFNEMILWNYLDDPLGLPHPSHTYWMPLASLLAAAGMFVLNQDTFLAARIPFILLAALIPPLTAYLTSTFTRQRSLILCAGLLAVVSGYYAPYLGTTDNFGLGMILGGLYFLALNRPGHWSAFLLGILAGFLTLSRSDGLLWLPMSWLVVYLWQQRDKMAVLTASATLRMWLFSFAGFLLVMFPWYARNLSVFGVPMAPGISRALWLTSYDQTFIFPASHLTFENWLSSGWNAIIGARWEAFKLNLLNTFGAQGLLILLPFILMGIWNLRRSLLVRIGVLAWLLIFSVMTLVFPFAGPRGSFFHAGATLQVLWWTLAVLGLDNLVTKVRSRRLFTPRAGIVFQSSLVLIAFMLTILVVVKSFGPEGAKQPFFYKRSAQADAFLLRHAAQKGDGVMIANPPAYYLVTGRPSFAIPDGDYRTVLAVAERYNVKYLILTKLNLPQGLKTIYQQPQSWPGLDYLGAVDDFYIFRILSSS